MVDAATIPNALPPPSEGFTHGGDLVLRSTDNVDFSVHALFLSVASPVFSDLLKSGSREEVVLFSERAELLALMLKFIYPRPTPNITSLDLLDDALRVASKYNLDSMKARLCEQLMLRDSPVAIHTDPLRALGIALKHGFTTGVELASSISSQQYDFGTSENLKKLLEVIQDPAVAALVKAIGIPFVKSRTLREVLFQFRQQPMRITNDIESMVCSICRAASADSFTRCPIEWQARWASWMFDNIKNRPISVWKDFFALSNVHNAFYQPHLPPTITYNRSGSQVSVCSCMSLLLGPSQKAFQPWADGVYKYLESQLGFIRELEAKIDEIDP
ncbi:Broad-Complex, Tramtrack and Bric a brac [Rhizoctonia solani]|uniref:Broad-Complex, Tramtrack and Bric a brac n=1 Tax=Rhizoctonia solani TaxID=456999 RepID=A0A8H7I1U2_9AGAM|nr:Broad-Complex, Tramtrack and Bric a brac [Rhizoctonia solani]